MNEETKLKWCKRFLKRCHYWQHGKNRRTRIKNMHAAMKMCDHACKHGGLPVPEIWIKCRRSDGKRMLKDAAEYGRMYASDD